MALVLADRVKETSTTTGTGSLTLAGAATGFQTFDAPLASSDTTYYVIQHQSAAEWEVGLGTFTSPSTLARTTILASSNSGSAVNLSAGTKDVFIGLPASKTSIGRQSIWVPCESMWIPATSGAGLEARVDGTQDRPLLMFDGASAEYATFKVRMPKSWDLGTLGFQVYWEAIGATTAGVVWGLQANDVGDNEAMNYSDATFTNVTDNGQSQSYELYISSRATLTVGSTPTTGNLLYFRFRRNPADASDTYTFDAGLVGLLIDYGTTSGNDD